MTIFMGQNDIDRLKAEIRKGDALVMDDHGALRKFNGPIDTFLATPVVAISQSDVFTRWEPPSSGSPHYSYGPEDEHWMRPLGLGKVVPIAFEMIDESPSWTKELQMEWIDKAYERMNIPSFFLAQDTSSNFPAARMASIALMGGF